MNSREKTNVYGRKFPIFGTQFGIFPKAKKETKERLARRVLKGFKDQRVTKATRGILGQWDLKDPQAEVAENKALWVHKAQREIKVTKETLAHKVQWGRRVLRV